MSEDLMANQSKLYGRPSRRDPKAPREGNPVALVTGASRGIGRACALQFASAGYDVVVNYRSSKDQAEEVVDLIEEMGRKALLVRADTADEHEVRAMFRETRKVFGRLDAVLANAGVTDDGLIATMSLDKWTRVINTNLTGSFLVGRDALKAMRNSGGSIVLMSSVTASRGQPGTANYSATKGAISSLTRTMSKEGAPLGVRVNAVAPGFVSTEMTTRITPTIRKALLDSIPMGRIAQTEEIAHVVEFLSGAGASYITGHVLTVDGGLTA